MVCGFSLLTAVPLLLIIWEVVRKGYRQISLSFFTENAPSTLDAMLAETAGESIPGGIANGILGTLSMTLIAALIAIPSGILAGVYLSEKRKTAFAGIVRFLTELLQGTPSIVIGIIAYAWIVVPLGKSLHAGRQRGACRNHAAADRPLDRGDAEYAAFTAERSRAGALERLTARS